MDNITKLSCAFLLLTILLTGALAQNYCKPSLCRNGKKHIACNNNGAFAPACGNNRKMITLTPQQRQLITNRHNTLRNQIASGGIPRYNQAVRMATMQWNAELAKIASFNVKQCVMKHDACRNTNAFHYAGQNLAMSGWSGKNRTVNEVILEHIQNWFDEQKDGSKSLIAKYRSANNGKKTGHFTQLVQEKATRVGCAVLRHQKGPTTQQLMACNYAFTNVIGKPVYRSGRAASQCKTGVNPKYKSLCSKREKYAVNTV